MKKLSKIKLKDADFMDDYEMKAVKGGQINTCGDACGGQTCAILNNPNLDAHTGVCVSSSNYNSPCFCKYPN